MKYLLLVVSALATTLAYAASCVVTPFNDNGTPMYCKTCCSTKGECRVRCWPQSTKESKP